MFRELARKNKKLKSQECIELLINEKRGVLSVLGDNDYPYGMPMNHYYNPVDGNIYFHCGKTGHRLDALRNCDKAYFCVYDKGQCSNGDWALQVKSVIVFGKVEIIDDVDTVAAITAALSRKFTSDEAYIREEIRRFGKATLLLKLIPDHMCGKQITES